MPPTIRRTHSQILIIRDFSRTTDPFFVFSMGEVVVLFAPSSPVSAAPLLLFSDNNKNCRGSREMLRDRKNARNDIIARLPKRSHTSETQSQLGVSYIHKEPPMVFYDIFISLVELGLRGMCTCSREWKREFVESCTLWRKTFLWAAAFVQMVTHSPASEGNHSDGWSYSESSLLSFVNDEHFTNMFINWNQSPNF